MSAWAWRAVWLMSLLGAGMLIHDVWQSDMEVVSKIVTNLWLLVGVGHALEGAITGRALFSSEATS